MSCLRSVSHIQDVAPLLPCATPWIPEVGLWTDSAWPYPGQTSQGFCWGETGVLGALPAWTQPGGLQCRHTTGAVGVPRGAAVLVGVGIDCPVMNPWWLLRS